MPEHHTTSLPAHAQLVQMGTAHWMSHVLYVAAKLDLAGHMAKGRTRVDDLAAATKAHSLSLGRFLRTLGHLGLVTEDGAGHFTLTPLGEALQAGAQGSARAAILTLASPWMTSGWERLLESVQTGRPGLEQALGMPIFDWLAKHPEEASLFSETMVSFHSAEPAAVAAVYDFSGMTIVDVGGATGNLLAAIVDNIQDHEAFCTTCHMSCAMPPNSFSGVAWVIVSRLCPAVSLNECLKEEMPTCSRTSFTIGQRSSA